MKRSFSKKGFSLIELLVVLGIIMILISLLMPALASLRQEARRRVCQVEMQQLSMLITAYCSDNKGRFPFVYEARPDGNWQMPSGRVLGPVGALTATSYWPMAMFDEFGNTMYTDALLCPDDTYSLEYRAWLAMELGVPESEVQARAIRGLSNSLLIDPIALQEPRERWHNWYFHVNAIHDAQFPSQKSFLVEDEPFHDYPYVPAIWPTGFHLVASALDGSVEWRSSVDAAPPIPLGIHREYGLLDDQVAWNIQPFQYTRDGIRGYDW